MMKKRIAVMLVLILAMTLAACGSANDTPEGALSAMLDDFKAGKSVDDYFTDDSLETGIIDAEAMADLYGLVMSIARDMDYTVEQTNQGADDAVVTVTITNKATITMLGDFFADYVATYMAESFELMFSGEELTEERAAEIMDEVTETMIEKYKDGEGLDSFTETVKVAMVKTGQGWKVDSDERTELVNAMMGFEKSGLESIFGELETQREE